MSSETENIPRVRSTTRTYYLDNFRAFLTALVIYHHTSIAYGGEGAVHYRSRWHSKASPSLLAFNAVNQTFFMASFFLISAHFTSTALSMKHSPPWRLLRSRAIRLGVPTLIYTIVSEPLHLTTLSAILHGESPDWNFLANDWRSIRGVRGPVWYCGLLLLFDAIHICLWSVYIRAHRFGPPSVVKQKIDESVAADADVHRWKTSQIKRSSLVLAVLLIISSSSFLIRLRFPVDYIFQLLNLRLGFLPQYIGYYIMGVSTLSDLDVFDFATSVRPANGHLWQVLLTTTVASTLAAGLIIFTLHASTDLDELQDSFSGGYNILAALYAVWNESTGFLLFSSLLSCFRKHLNHPMPLWTDAPRHSYVAFLVHRPVSEAIEATLDDWRAGAVSKTIVVGSVNVIFSWIIGWNFLGKVLLNTMG